MLLFASSIDICQREVAQAGIIDSGMPAIDGIRMNALAGEAGLTVAILPRRALGHRHGSSFQPASNDRVRS